MRHVFFITIFVLIASEVISSESFINPITDICWECVFPISISGVNVTPGYEDTRSHTKRVCFCGGTPPKAGVPLTFWEPSKMVDVTRHAYKLIGLGGISVGKENIKNRGTVGNSSGGATQTSFYQVHLYDYPILQLLEMFTDFSSCMDKGDVDVAYMSELDLTWNDDNLALILNPEAGFFANRLAQSSCMGDCISTTLSKPSDKLFWCAGCQGSLYPFSGTVAHHVGAVQASALLVNRVLAKLHRSYLLKGFKKDNYCDPKYMPIIQKSLYRTQLVRPIANTSGKCPNLGESDVVWGAGKSYPFGGEDFVYLIWVKKQCCLDAVKPAMTAFGG